MIVNKENYDRKYLSQRLWEICDAAYGYGAPWNIHQIYEDLHHMSQSKYFIGVNEDEIYGFISFQVILDEAEIINIAIHPKYQGKNLSKVLLYKVIEELVSMNVSTLFLEVRESNEKAIHIYQQIGFIIIGKRKKYYHSPQEDALLMKLEINQEVKK